MRLKTCPFCGGKAELHVGQHAFVDCFVRCSSCGSESGLFMEDLSESANKKAAVKAWNRRVQP